MHSCREGTMRMEEIMERVNDRHGDAADLDGWAAWAG